MASAVEQQQQQQQQSAGGGGGGRAETGFYCSTSGTYFSDKESLAEHYKSDFHRYNLKRKVAGLPPVTKDWFEARKAQLTSAAASPHSKAWYDPLTKKKFQTQQTYQAHVNSKKYQQLVRDSGQPAPAPIIMVKQLTDDSAINNSADDNATSSSTNGGAAAATGTAAGAAGQGSSAAKPGAGGFTMKAPARRSATDAGANGHAAAGGAEGDEDDEASSGWETASESDGAADAAAEEGDDEEQEQEEGGEWQEWDPRVSFFDNKVSSSMEDNLQYMYKKFGFFLPDAEYLADPEGLIKYLGAKLSYGKVPLYTAGDDPNAKQFRSLHAVQRHMVDTNQCRMAFDDNEEEYEDFYDYSTANADREQQQDDGGAGADGPASSSGGADDDAAAAQGKQLALAMDSLTLGGLAGTGWELAVPSKGPGAGSKVLGSREFARYYRQRPKPQDTRQSVIVNTIIAQYKSLGLATKTSTPPMVQRAAQRQEQNKHKRKEQLLFMRNNVNHNLPKNVPY